MAQFGGVHTNGNQRGKGQKDAGGGQPALNAPDFALFRRNS